MMQQAAWRLMGRACRSSIGLGAASGATRTFAATAGAPPAAVKPAAHMYVLFVPPAVCGFLAYWQWQRKDWKEEEIRKRSAMLGAEPVNVYDLQELKEYTKVSATGMLLHDDSMFVGPRPRSVAGSGVQGGYLVITPMFDPQRRSFVLVNRGFVPTAWKGDVQRLASAHDAQPAPSASPAAASPTTASPAASTSGRGWFGWSRAATVSKAIEQPAVASPSVVTVQGVLQPSETPSGAMPDNKPEAGEWHWLDVPTMAEACGLPPDTPLITAVSDDLSAQQQMKVQNPLQATRSAGMYQQFHGAPEYPIPKHTADVMKFGTMPKDHAVYAATWLALFVALSYMARQAIWFPRKHSRIIDSDAVWRARAQAMGAEAPKAAPPAGPQASTAAMPKPPSNASA